MDGRHSNTSMAHKLSKPIIHLVQNGKQHNGKGIIMFYSSNKCFWTNSEHAELVCNMNWKMFHNPTTSKLAKMLHFFLEASML